MQILVPQVEDSALALFRLDVQPGEALPLADSRSDSLLYAIAGSGSLSLDGATHELRPGGAALVLAGEEAVLVGGGQSLSLLRATVGPEADRHTSLGQREVVVSADGLGSEPATGDRSFQMLLGPHNGSSRATLFAGFLPPGRAPWHYHLYDEIVFVPEGPGRVHRRGSEDALGPGSAFRLRPREVHIVENASSDREMTVLGVFTPAGSPAAAYLPLEADG